MKPILKRNGKLTVGKSSIITSGQLYIVSAVLIPDTKVEYTLEVSYGGKVILKRFKKPKIIRKVSHDKLGKIIIISPKLIPGDVVDYTIEINELNKKKDK